jgi:hypothetical protein
MDLAIEPDYYVPGIDDNGNYVDKIPNFNTIKTDGLLCSCGSRKDKVYRNHTSFSGHIKTKTHQNWLETLNINKKNYFMENKELQDTIHNQRLIIAKLEKDLSNRDFTIDYLTKQIQEIQGSNNYSNIVVNDLIDFDCD